MAHGGLTVKPGFSEDLRNDAFSSRFKYTREYPAVPHAFPRGVTRQPHAAALHRLDKLLPQTYQKRLIKDVILSSLTCTWLRRGTFYFRVEILSNILAGRPKSAMPRTYPKFKLIFFA